MATMKLHLDRDTIKALPIPEAGKLTVHDDALAGFELLVLPSGTMTYYYHGRTRSSRQFSYKIGRTTEISADKARAMAERVRAQVALDQDPAAERKAARQREPEAKRVRAATISVNRMAELWQQANAKRWAASTAISYRSWLDTHVLPALGRMSAHEVQPADIRRMYRAILAKRPATADQALRTTSAMYAWGVGQDDLPLITTNPCAGALARSDRGPGANQRVREPEGDELDRLKVALEDRGDMLGVFFLLLLLTGCRESEMLQARWGEFDLDVPLPVWRKPTTKNRKPHRVTLEPPSPELLRAVKAAHPVAPFSWLREKAMRAAWAEIVKAAAIEDLRIHDLRHFHASLLAGEGFGLLDIGKALGHRSPQTTAIYTHLPARRQREGSRAVGEVWRLAGRRPA
jgi:integrase